MPIVSRKLIFGYHYVIKEYKLTLNNKLFASNMQGTTVVFSQIESLAEAHKKDYNTCHPSTRQKSPAIVISYLSSCICNKFQWFIRIAGWKSSYLSICVWFLIVSLNNCKYVSSDNDMWILLSFWPKWKKHYYINENG